MTSNAFACECYWQYPGGTKAAIGVDIGQFTSGGWCVIGWVYWPDMHSVAAPYGGYNRVQKLSNRAMATSDTLASCQCYDTTPSGNPWPSVFPHTKGGGLLVVPAGQKTGFPPNHYIQPDGLVVSQLDASAQWTPIKKLVKVVGTDFNWYAPR
jgi:hypothetical protein